MSVPHAVPGSSSDSSEHRDDDSRTVEAMVQALHAERCHLDDLRRALERQRAAVSAQDIDGVEASVREVQSILLTLGEAMTRRRHLTELLAGTEGMELDRLGELLADRYPAVPTAVGELVAAARVVGTELDTSHTMLRAAIAAGDHYLRTMRDDEDGESLYGRASNDERHSRSVLFDRQV